MSKVSFLEIWRNDDDDDDDIMAYILLAHVNTIVHVSALPKVCSSSSSIGVGRENGLHL